MSLKKAKEVIQIEIQALKDLAHRLDANFLKAVEIILKCKGVSSLPEWGKPESSAEKSPPRSLRQGLRACGCIARKRFTEIWGR